MDTKNILILLAEWYLNGVLIGYLIYFFLTVSYVRFMRAPSISFMEALDKPAGKRLKIQGQFCGYYPRYPHATLNMSTKIDLNKTATIVLKDGMLQFGNEVVINGRILYENGVLQITRVKAISPTHVDSIKVYMANKFNQSMYIAYGGSTLWLLLQILVF